MKQNGRRRNALARLESQLASGVKPEKKTGKELPLEEKDVKRIKKEIATLKKRV